MRRLPRTRSGCDHFFISADVRFAIRRRRYVGIRNRNSGLMRNNKYRSLLDRATIQQWSANGLAPQRWRLERAN